MAKKTKKRTQQQEVPPRDSVVEVPAQVAEEPGPEEMQPPAPEPPAPAARTRKPPKAREPKGATKRAAKEPRAERESVLDLDPADEIKPVRAGTHLADVLELTARAEGATAIELDKAIVTTARSVRHYGLWALRYPLHKEKGFGFRTVLTDGEPARYHLVLPKGQKLASFLAARKSGSSPAPKAVAPKGRSTKKATKAHGKKLAAARA